MISSGAAASSPEVVLPRASKGRLGEFLEERVRLAIDDAIALQNRGTAEGLRQMALAGAWSPEEEHVLALGDEARGGELVDERAIHLLVEIKIKGVERALRIAKACELVAAFEQTVLTSAEFVSDEGGHQVDGRLLFGLRLPEPGFERGGHAGEPELAEGAIEFHEIHAGSPVC